jgi:hypothetical protein
MARKRDSVDRELTAIGRILDALDGLDGESVQRVLDYVFGRLSIAPARHVKSIPSALPHATPTEARDIRRTSIRDLRDEKQPESSNQMAALVAYYLSEIADDSERKEAVNTSDLERYFKQAGFKLPKSLPQTLPNAAAAGYFDPTSGGLYRLNAVGYNLVAHGLPRARYEPAKRSRRRSNKKSKKPNR